MQHVTHRKKYRQTLIIPPSTRPHCSVSSYDFDEPVRREIALILSTLEREAG
jgi:hypothetical protein